MRLWLTCALLSVLWIVAGCQTSRNASFCTVASPIRLSAHSVDALTDREVTQVLALNEKGHTLCGWKP